MTETPTRRAGDTGAAPARRTGDDDSGRAGRATTLAVLSVLLPPAAWLVSLAASYVLQDFTCSAFANAGRPGPGDTLLVLLLVGNALLLALTVLAGIVGWRQWRSGRSTVRFLGLVGAGLSVFFGLGILMIGLPPLFLEVCP